MKPAKFNKKLLLLPIVGLVAIVVLATFLLLPTKPSVGQSGSDDTPESTGSSLLYTEPNTPFESILLTNTVAGQTAFDLLRSAAEVAYQEYPFGVFISGINGVAADDQHYWAVYLNGEYAQVGADQLKLQPQDVVEFRYEAIDSSPM